MLKIEVSDGKGKVEMKGKASELIEQMFIAIGSFHRSLNTENALAAHFFKKELLENFEGIFSNDDIKIKEVYKTRHRQRRDQDEPR